MRPSSALAAALVLAAPLARAEAPTRYQTEAFAVRWLAGFKPDEGEKPKAPAVAEPFLFAVEGEACAKKKTGADVVACLMKSSKVPLGPVTALRQRFHGEASFPTWQHDPKHDVIEQHRKELKRLADHAFLHLELDGHEGTWEVVVGVKLVDSRPVVDALLANFIDEGADLGVTQSREVAGAWLAALGTSDASRKTLAAKTAFPFVAMGLDGKAGCAAEQTAPSAAKLGAVLACAGAPGELAFAKIPTTGWDSIHDPASIPTRAPKEKDTFPKALERLDRMTVNHVLSFNRVDLGEQHLEVLVAVRLDGRTPKVDAIAVNRW